MLLCRQPKLDKIKFIKNKMTKTPASDLVKTLRYNLRTNRDYISKVALITKGAFNLCLFITQRNLPM